MPTVPPRPVLILLAAILFLLAGIVASRFLDTLEWILLIIGLALVVLGITDSLFTFRNKTE